MDRANRKKTTIIEGIITAFISSIIALIINSSVNYFNKENINISISESTSINGKYNTCIAIKNYQKNKSIDKIKIWINEGEILGIDTNIKNTYDKDNKSLMLDEIIPEYKGTIIIHSNMPVNSENLRIETDTKSNIVFLSEQKESAYINIRNYAIICFIYFAMLSASNIYSKLYTNKKIYEAKEEAKKVKEEQDNIKAELEKVKESCKNTNYKIKNVRIKYLKIIKDYSKELDFWKDTIRKILYNSKKHKIEEEDVFKEVTMNLKTFHTLDKCSYSDLYEVLDKNDKKDKE